ncbi:MAG: sarcosine oxidase subunit gamma [Pseudomonadota bacterium]
MLDPVSPLGGYDRDIGGLRIAEDPRLALVSLALPRDGEAAAEAAIQAAFGVALPPVGQSSVNQGKRLIRMSPDQAMLAFESDAPLAEPEVRKALGDTVYTTNQTDAWAALRVSGAGMVRALERLCPLDLEALAVDAAERTMFEHMGVIVIRETETAVLLLTPSTTARSFLHAVEISARYTMAAR